MHDDSAALKVLREVFGFERFRGPQQAIIEHVMAGGPPAAVNRCAIRSLRCYVKAPRLWSRR